MTCILVHYSNRSWWLMQMVFIPCCFTSLLLCKCVCVLNMLQSVERSDGRWLAGPMETHTEVAGTQRAICRGWFWAKRWSKWAAQLPHISCTKAKRQVAQLGAVCINSWRLRILNIVYYYWLIWKLTVYCVQIAKQSVTYYWRNCTETNRRLI